jgi:predicted kinase
MLNRCTKCGKYHADKIISDDGQNMICPNCKEQQQFKRLPLFIITGASGVGKSTLSSELYKNEVDYIVLESDILWFDFFNTPEDNYRKYRETWLRLCKNISQAGKPVVLCGCSVPEQFENCIERRYFSEIYYLACVCDSDILEKRLREGRNVKDENWIQGSISFNQWLKDNADKTEPNITLLDTSQKSVEEAYNFADEWIKRRL